MERFLQTVFPLSSTSKPKSDRTSFHYVAWHTHQYADSVYRRLYGLHAACTTEKSATPIYWVEWLMESHEMAAIRSLFRILLQPLRHTLQTRTQPLFAVWRYGDVLQRTLGFSGGSQFAYENLQRRLDRQRQRTVLCGMPIQGEKLVVGSTLELFQLFITLRLQSELYL